MIDYTPLVDRWRGTPLDAWADLILTQIDSRFHVERFGDLPRWQHALSDLPAIEASHIDLNSPAITVGPAENASQENKDTLERALRALHPWRKGPFELFGIHVDTEWRSDWKWDRLIDGIESLAGKRVLDVGCGSGYHCWRMRGAGASEVIGIDPTPLFICQFQALQHYINDPACWVLPLGIEHVPDKLQAFDTVFSMGVLYHRRSPMDHLIELRDSLVPGGEMLLETLVVDGSEGECLVPEDRYSRMGNVWFLPSVDTLKLWLRKLRFRDVKLIDVTVTSKEEQRSTDWMTFNSLQDFLDPEDHSKTIEGYPAPRRAILSCRAP